MSRGSGSGSRGLRQRDSLAIGAPARQVIRRESRGARVATATRLVLGRRAATTAIGDRADLAVVRDVPQQTGLVVSVHGQRGDTAAQVGAGCGEAGDAEENGERGGLHGVGTNV